MIEDFPSNPYAPPEAPLELGERDTEGFRPIPFEDVDALPGFWLRVGHMFKLVFTDPFAFYDRMAVTEGLGAPMRFLMVMMVPFIVIMVLMFAVLGFMPTFLGADAKGPEPRWMFPVMMGFAAVFYPVGIVLGTLLWGAINHACLWMWRGTANSVGIGQSLRATVYTYAFILLVSFVPLAGALGMLAGVAFIGIGLARLHRTQIWRGIAAVFTPVLLCCGLYAAFIAIFIASGAFK
jgi:hypothetical protein